MDLRRFGLYVETRSSSHADAQRVAARILLPWRDAKASLREEAPNAARLKELAIVAAHSRGANAPFPRVVQMSVSQREEAFVWLVSHAPPFSDLAVDALGDLAALERMLGLRSGRGGAERNLWPEFDLAADLAKADLEVAFAALGNASDAHAEVARAAVELICVWMPALIPVLRLGSKQPFAGMLRVAIEAAPRFTPLTYAGHYALVLSRLARLSDSQLSDIETFAPASAVAMMLASEPSSVQAAAIRRLRPWQRFGLEFVLSRARSDRVI